MTIVQQLPKTVHCLSLSCLLVNILQVANCDNDPVEYYTIKWTDVNNRERSGDDATGAGASPLFIASQYGLLEMVKLLLDNGAQHDPKLSGSTPLLIASQNGHVETVKVLFISHR